MGEIYTTQKYIQFFYFLKIMPLTARPPGIDGGVGDVVSMGFFLFCFFFTLADL